METDFSGYSQATTSGPDFSSASMGLSDEAMASIGSDENQDRGFFGGSDATQNFAFDPNNPNIMDFGRGSVSNITNAVNYDPNFAALSMMDRGLTPGFDLRNQINFDVPSSMLPQLEGSKGPLAPKFYSPVERTLVEMEPVGIMSMVGRGLQSMMDSAKSSFNDAKQALGLTGDAAGGFKDEDFTGLMSTRDDASSGTVPMSDMSQQGAGIPITNPVVTTPTDFTGLMSTRTPTFDAFGNVTRDANMSRFADQFGQINAGIASIAPSQAQEVGDAMRDTFVTTTPNISVPGFKSSPMSKQDADRIKENLKTDNPVYQQMTDASQFLNPQAISQGLNYFAGPQIQDFFRGVTNNPNTTIELGPRFDMEKQKLDDNIFTINVPLRIG